MAFTKITASGDGSWTKIVDNKSVATIQNVGHSAFYMNFTSTDSPPVDEVGMVVQPFTIFTKQTVADLTGVAGAVYVWIKPLVVDGTARVIVEVV